MPFKVKIVFTGVCMFVPNNDPSKRVKVCVVLPDAEGPGNRRTTSKKAPDGTFLRRHRAFVKFNMRQLADAQKIPSKCEGLLYIEGKRVAFKFAEGADEFKIDPSVRRHILDMSEIAGPYADDFADIVGLKPPLVTSQILLDRGILKNEFPVDKLSTWVVPNTLNSLLPPMRRILTHEVTLELLNIASVELHSMPLEGGEAEVLQLKALAEEDVVITISHLCDENPLRWEAEDAQIKDDEDYKWHYMLLSPAIRTKLELGVLHGLALPVPLRPLNMDSAGQGVNCPPSTGRARFIDLDQFLPS